MLFLYDPACREGRMRRHVEPQGPSGLGRLPLAGGAYDGTVHSAFQIRSCHGGTLTETLAFTTKVIEASADPRPVAGHEDRGTLHESAPASGCVTATIDWMFTGFIQT